MLGRKRKIKIRKHPHQIDEVKLPRLNTKHFKKYHKRKKKIMFSSGLSPAAMFLNKAKKSITKHTLIGLIVLFATIAVVPLLVIYLTTTYLRLFSDFVNGDLAKQESEKEIV